MLPVIHSPSAVALITLSPLVVWDGDDTLWFVEQLYDSARAAVADLVRSSGFNAETWDTLQRAVDLDNVGTMGLSRLRFPTSCVEAPMRVAADEGVVLSPCCGRTSGPLPMRCSRQLRHSPNTQLRRWKRWVGLREWCF